MKESVKDKFVTVQSLAARLSCTDAHVYNMIREGLIVAVKIGGRAVRISDNSIEAYLAANVIDPRECVVEEAPESNKGNERPVARSSWIST